MASAGISATEGGAFVVVQYKDEQITIGTDEWDKLCAAHVTESLARPNNPNAFDSGLWVMFNVSSDTASTVKYKLSTSCEGVKFTDFHGVDYDLPTSAVKGRSDPSLKSYASKADIDKAVKAAAEKFNQSYVRFKAVVDISVDGYASFRNGIRDRSKLSVTEQKVLEHITQAKSLEDIKAIGKQLHIFTTSLRRQYAIIFAEKQGGMDVAHYLRGMDQQEELCERFAVCLSNDQIATRSNMATMLTEGFNPLDEQAIHQIKKKGHSKDSTAAILKKIILRMNWKSELIDAGIQQLDKLSAHEQVLAIAIIKGYQGLIKGLINVYNIDFINDCQYRLKNRLHLPVIHFIAHIDSFQANKALTTLLEDNNGLLLTKVDGLNVVHRCCMSYNSEVLDLLIEHRKDEIVALAQEVGCFSAGMGVIRVTPLKFLKTFENASSKHSPKDIEQAQNGTKLQEALEQLLKVSD